MYSCCVFLSEDYIYNTECELKIIRTMMHYELWRQLFLSNLDPEKFGGQDHLAGIELFKGVFKNKSSKVPFLKENKITKIQ